MKIHILERGFGKKHPYKRLREALFRPYWFPLENAAHELSDLGVSVQFYKKLDTSIFNCDLLILSGRTVDEIVADPSSTWQTRAEFCHDMSLRGTRLIWFDSRDSAGNCQFDVMPFVDLYLKRQLYRDRSAYLKTLYGGRQFSDYYHRNYGVHEEPGGDVAYDVPFRPHEVAPDIGSTDKMRVAWGCGAEFHWPLFRQPQAQIGYFSRRYLQRALRSVYAVPDTIPVSKARAYDVCALFDHKRYSMKTVGYQRRIGLEHAMRLETSRKVTGRVPKTEFYNTLADSAVAVSVFGWGEVCYREYEATYCGASILMADMSGIETFPNFYQPGVYYTPFAWDFSDFAEKFDGLMANPSARLDMAENAQQFLVSQWSADGRRAFAERFLDIVKPVETRRRNVQELSAALI